MAKINEAHVGSDFDAFLAESGTLEESEAIALKRVQVLKDDAEAEFDFDSLPELLAKLRDWHASAYPTGFDHSILAEAIAAVVVLQAMAKEAPHGTYHTSRKILLEMAFGEGKGLGK